MLNRARKGWKLTQHSLRILHTQKRLLILPLCGSIAAFILLAISLVLLWHIETHVLTTQHVFTFKNTLMFLLFFIDLFFFNWILFFSNAAMVASVTHYLKTNQLSLRYGLHTAFSRFPAIFKWTLFITTIGIIIRIFQSNSRKFTGIPALLMGLSWSVISYFVIPVLLFENVSPLRNIKRSAQLAKQTWGPFLTANFSVGLLFVLARLSIFVPLIIGLYWGGTDQIIGLIVTLVLFIILTILIIATNNILHSALYLFAVEGNSFGPFKKESIRTAFQTRNPSH